MKQVSILVSLLLLLAAELGAGSCESICTMGEPNPALLDHLAKERGVILVLRHTAKCRGTCPDIEAREDCLESQKGLTQVGRDQAEAIRDGLAAAGFTNAKILSSRYCRTVQGAEILSAEKPLPMKRRRVSLQTDTGLEGVRTVPKPRSKNQVLVTHSNILETLKEECLADFTLEEDTYYGLALVYSAQEKGEKRILQGCVWPDEWDELTEAASSPE